MQLILKEATEISTPPLHYSAHTSAVWMTDTVFLLQHESRLLLFGPACVGTQRLATNEYK